VPAEGDKVGIALVDNRFRTVPLEAAGRDDRSIEYAAQLASRDRWESVGAQFRSDDARFDQMQISETEAVELCDGMAEQGVRVAVRHRAEAAARSEPDADAIGAPHRCDGVGDFEQQARSVLDRSAIAVAAFVRTVLQELIDQIAVGAVDFDAIEARRLGADRTLAELLDDLPDLRNLECAARRRLDPAFFGEDEILDRNG
jgi:hypothetical protein